MKPIQQVLVGGILVILALAVPGRVVFAIAGGGQAGQAQQSAEETGQQETNESATDELVLFQNKAAGFEVNQFAEPEENVVEVDLPETDDTGEDVGSRKIKVHMYMSQSKDFNVAMVTAYHDLPDSPATKDAIKKVLDGAVLGAVNSVKGTPTSHVEIKLGENPGRQVEYKATRFGADLRGVSRIYLRGNRVYQSNYISTVEKFDDSQAKEFFDSFKLVKIEQE